MTKKNTHTASARVRYDVCDNCGARCLAANSPNPPAGTCVPELDWTPGGEPCCSECYDAACREEEAMEAQRLEEIAPVAPVIEMLTPVAATEIEQIKAHLIVETKLGNRLFSEMAIFGTYGEIVNRSFEIVGNRTDIRVRIEMV